MNPRDHDTGRVEPFDLTEAGYCRGRTPFSGLATWDRSPSGARDRAACVAAPTSSRRWAAASRCRAY